MNWHIPRHGTTVTVKDITKQTLTVKEYKRKIDIRKLDSKVW